MSVAIHAKPELLVAVCIQLFSRMNDNPSAQFLGKDHADLYALYRPKSPQIIVDRIISYLREKYAGKWELAIDVGCGSGQCTDLLAPHFTRILATDISESQIEVAKSLNHLPNITFQVSPAESCPVETGSVQLVNAATCAHWFDLPAFFKEVERILCPNGILSMFSHAPCILLFDDYYSSTAAKELIRLLDVLEKETLGPYWSSNIRLVNEEYIEMLQLVPFKDAIREEFWIEEGGTIEDMINLTRSWSGFQNYCKTNGVEAGQELLDELASKIKRALGAEEKTDSSLVEFKMKRKYFLVMGQKT